MVDLPVLGPDEVRDEPLDWPIVSHELLGGGVISDFVRDVAPVSRVKPGAGEPCQNRVTPCLRKDDPA